MCILKVIFKPDKVMNIRMKLPKRVCACICLLRVFFYHVTVSLLNTHKYAMDSTDTTLTATRALIMGGSFTGHLAKPDFAIAFGENSAINVKFYFYFTFRRHCSG